MAISLGGSQTGGGFGRRRYGSSVGTLSDINIIPLVDVVLVLLIIFMLTAHVMDFGLEINAPEVTNTHDSIKELPVVGITKDQRIFLNQNPVKLVQLTQELDRNFKGQKSVYVMGDRALRLDLFMNVIDQLSQAKFQINVVTKPFEAPSRAR